MSAARRKHGPRGTRHRSYKFSIIAGRADVARLAEAFANSRTIAEFVIAPHDRDNTTAHLQGYFRAPKGSKLTEREARARIEAAGFASYLIRVLPLVGRNAVEG
ncbi:MAG: hypothetical protein ACK5L6_00790, partial [Anaerorhabdus sp.]|uniref:hypothetical protein n=1 Tax=Anaerorhabdus sp. TaxID=1872524 RepID=UPI003A848D31